MTAHDYEFTATPVPEDSVTIAGHARRMQSRALGAGISRALHAGAATAAKFIGAVIKLPFAARTSRSLQENGNAGTSDAIQLLRPRAPLVLPQSERRTVTCDTGTVWVTQGGTGDYVLQAGESLQLHPVGEVLVTAMAGPAVIHLTLQQKSRSLLDKEKVMTGLELRERDQRTLGAAMGKVNSSCCA